VFRPSVAESDPKQFIHLLRFSVFRDTYLAVNSLGTQINEPTLGINSGAFDRIHTTGVPEPFHYPERSPSEEDIGRVL
jgi:hypothetical protein